MELEETDPSAVDLPVNQDVGCLQPVSKQHASKRVKENYGDALFF